MQKGSRCVQAGWAAAQAGEAGMAGAGVTFSSLEHAVHAVWGRRQLRERRVPTLQDRGAVEGKDEENQGQKTLQR